MNRREIELNAYAKINLSLRVTGRREDGYHNIRSLMQGIDLYDVIKISKCPENGTKYNLPHCTIDGVVVYLCTDVETIPTDMSNLALKGIKAVLDACRSDREGQAETAEAGRSQYGGDGGEGDLAVQDDQGDGGEGDLAVQNDRCGDGNRGDRARSDDLIVYIDKRLPVAAGIAGGSGNAAACMLGMNALMGSPLSLRELMSIGAGVGADVPFSLMMNAAKNGGVLAGLDGLKEARAAAWIGGIGDIVEPTDPMKWHVVMANPGIAVSTKAAYEAIDAILQGSEEDIEEFPLLVNDLELYTLRDYPEAERLRKAMLEELGADVVLMSGSGPTMIAYYKDAKSAASGYSRMREMCETEALWRTWQTTTGL